MFFLLYVLLLLIELLHGLFQVDANKASQKWRNVQRDYKNFKTHVKATGGGRRDPPWFYDEVDEFLSQRHTVNPVAVVDTLSLGKIVGMSVCCYAPNNFLAVIHNTRKGVGSIISLNSTVRLHSERKCLYKTYICSRIDI